MKTKLLLSILAVVPAVLLPLAASSQIAPEREKPVAGQTEPAYKYEAFVGYGYTSINQVNQSRYGLQGVNLSIMRDWGKYFGIKADGAFYQWATNTGNPGKPSVDLVLFGPEAHAPLYGHISGFVHGLLGGAHTGGEQIQPKVSFAGGIGAGMEYSVTRKIAIRASGDDIASSFTLSPYQRGDSPHERWNSRATIGVVYKF